MLTLDENRRRYELYKQGFSDKMIGKKLNYSSKTINDWREKRGLPSNKRNGFENQIDDSMICGSDKNWKSKRIEYIKKQLKRIEQIIDCKTTFLVNLKNLGYAIRLEKGKTKTEILLSSIDSVEYISNKDFQLYIDDKLKSAMNNFVRKRYDGK